MLESCFEGLWYASQEIIVTSLELLACTLKKIADSKNFIRSSPAQDLNLGEIIYLATKMY